MTVKFRNYVNDTRFGKDYQQIWEFLNRINENEFTTPNFLWGRWVWMISRPVDDEHLRNKIGIWEEDGKIVALATFEHAFGEVYLCIDKEYRFLIQDMITYAKENLSNEGKLILLINDNDREIQNIAEKNNFRPTQNKERVSKLDINDQINYTLPEGFSVISMADDWSFSQYNRVLWRGFNHEGEPDQSEDNLNWRKTMLSSPHVKKVLIVSIVSPNGNYVSHCGLWYNTSNKYAYVEPVATDPDYRKLGLGKAAVYETIKRAMKLGAKEIFVGSSQQFYYNIGFKPYTTETWWELKN